MPRVKFTSALKRFFPSITDTVVEAHTMQGIINSLNQKYPGLSNYLVDDSGRLRQHVNIFVKNEMIQDREKLSDLVQMQDEILIFQALSGG